MNRPLPSPMLSAALGYAAQGWPVFPCNPSPAPDPYSKAPLDGSTVDGRKGLYLATTDEATIRGWWKRWPKALIGVPTGAAVGAIVVDLDPRDEPADAMLRAVADFCGGVLPPCPVTRTQSGGLHLWFRHPGGEVGNRAKLFKVRGAFVGPESIDVRGDGGYVIVPPSVMADGQAYHWEMEPDLRRFPPAPPLLLDLILRRGRFDPSAGAPGSPDPAPALPAGESAQERYGLSALDLQVRELRGMGPGGRGSALNTSAFKMGQLVGARALERALVERALYAAADANGLVATDGRKRVEDTIARGLTAGIAEPRDLRDVGRKTEARRAPAGEGPAASSPAAPTPEPPETARGRDPEEPPPPEAGGFDVEDLNREFALVLMGSKAVIVHEQPQAPVEDRVRILSLEAFRAWHLNRFTETRARDGKIKVTTWASAWLASRERRQCRGIEFHPDPDDAPGTEGYFNLWRGFAVRPDRSAGRYTVFQDHLLNNLCRGDRELFRWVFGWFAHIVQRPRERIGTALVCRGKMGTGKTVVGQVFGSLFPQHYFLVDDPRYLVGQFNAHMASCLLLQADEGFWAGDKAAEGRLKGLVSAETQMIESKGVDPIRLKNYVRLLITSNEDWVIPAGKDERRFCVLDIDPRCAQNHDYFREMDEELGAGGREALLADLLAFDLDSVNLRQIPRTDALLEQKLRSLDPVESWWFERLRAGAPTKGMEAWGPEVPTAWLFEDYCATAERIGVRRKAEETAFSIKLRRLIPGIERKRRWIEIDGSNKKTWCYVLPDLAECRAAFQTEMSQDLTWGDDEEEGGPPPKPEGGSLLGPT